jgi:hypothetical protein
VGSIPLIPEYPVDLHDCLNFSSAGDTQPSEVVFYLIYIQISTDRFSGFDNISNHHSGEVQHSVIVVITAKAQSRAGKGV